MITPPERKNPFLRSAIFFIAVSCWAAELPQQESIPAYDPHEVTLPKNAPYVLSDGSVYIVGTDGMQEILKEFNQLFIQTHPGFKFKMLLKGSSTGIGGLTAGVSAFAPMGRAAWPLEVRPFRQVYSYEPTDIHIGRDGYTASGRISPPAIYVNARNSLGALPCNKWLAPSSPAPGRETSHIGANWD